VWAQVRNAHTITRIACPLVHAAVPLVLTCAPHLYSCALGHHVCGLSWFDLLPSICAFYGCGVVFAIQDSTILVCCLAAATAPFVACFKPCSFATSNYVLFWQGPASGLQRALPHLTTIFPFEFVTITKCFRHGMRKRCEFRYKGVTKCRIASFSASRGANVREGSHSGSSHQSKVIECL
jgi:hypothetical protein